MKQYHNKRVTIMSVSEQTHVSLFLGLCYSKFIKQQFCLCIVLYKYETWSNLMSSSGTDNCLGWKMLAVFLFDFSFFIYTIFLYNKMFIKCEGCIAMPEEL